MEYSDQQIVWRLLKYGWRYKGAWLLMLLATGAMAGASGYLVLVVKDALDLLQAPAGHRAGLYRLGARLLLMSPLAAVAYGAAWAIGQQLANACLRDLRNDFLGHLVRLELLFHKQLSPGDLLTRITSDFDATGALFQDIFGKLL